VIYTSGSTGRPKGVVVEHRGVAGLVCWASGRSSADELSRVLASTSLSFDVSVFEIVRAAGAGGSIEVVDLLALAGVPTWQGSLISAVPSRVLHDLDGAVRAGPHGPGADGGAGG
jgi:nonribosomal peptide synthetase DhbF